MTKKKDGTTEYSWSELAYRIDTEMMESYIERIEI